MGTSKKNKSFANIVFKFFNFLTIKTKRSIYINLGLSSKNNYEDILNYDGNNVLSFTNAFINTKHSDKFTVYVDYFDESRKEQYDAISEKVKDNNIRLKFVKSYLDKRGIKRIFGFLRKYARLFKCKIWIVGTGDAFIYGKVKRQKFIDLNYFISCKNDMIRGEPYRWSYLDYILTTSQLNSTTVSAQTGVKLESCIELGFPRNDTLFLQKNKDIIMGWLKKECGYEPKKIIVYAPTYRDYEKNGDKETRGLFGYDMPHLEKFLLGNKFCVVCKLHNLQDKSILVYPKGVVKFKLCYDFSFYDLMSISDCVITDYSSLGYDFLILNKPLIYNLYDLDKYIEDRGLSYSPYEYFCPGEIVKNEKEMMKALDDTLLGKDTYSYKRKYLIEIFHKYKDNQSSQRVVDFIEKLFSK